MRSGSAFLAEYIRVSEADLGAVKEIRLIDGDAYDVQAARAKTSFTFVG